MAYKFNNKHLSSINFKLVKNTFPQLKKIKKEIQVVGRNGSIFIDTKAYQNRIIKCEHISTKFNDAGYNKLYDFFSDFEGSLVFDTDSNLKWEVDSIELEDIEEEALGLVHKFTASFICKPFRKLINEKEYQLTASEIRVENAGIVECYPNFVIDPLNYNTDIILFVNNEEFRILNVNHTLGPIKILGDSKTVIQNNKPLETKGKFPKLHKGTNVVKGSNTYLNLRMSLNENYA